MMDDGLLMEINFFYKLLHKTSISAGTLPSIQASIDFSPPTLSLNCFANAFVHPPKDGLLEKYANKI